MTPVTTINFPMMTSASLTEADCIALRLAIKWGSKVDGIRYIRARFGYGLRDAKALFDAYAESQPSFSHPVSA